MGYYYWELRKSARRGAQFTRTTVAREVESTRGPLGLVFPGELESQPALGGSLDRTYRGLAPVQGDDWEGQIT